MLDIFEQSMFHSIYSCVCFSNQKSVDVTVGGKPETLQEKMYAF